MSVNSTKKMRLALVLLKQRRQQFADWKESCAAERRQGYAPSACVHGTSRWTDYDNICGPCEDGLGWWDFAAQARDCLNEAEAVEQRVRERIKVAGDMANMDGRHRTAGHDLLPWHQIADWVNLPYKPWGLHK